MGTAFVPKRREQRETAFQVGVMTYLRVALPLGAVALHIPNEGRRTKAEAGILHGMGLLPGAPDLLILYEGHPVFIELKDPKAKRAKPKAHQEVVHQLLRRAGADVFTANSFEAIEEQLNALGIPMKARLGPITKTLRDVGNR